MFHVEQSELVLRFSFFVSGVGSQNVPRGTMTYPGIYLKFSKVSIPPFPSFL